MERKIGEIFEYNGEYYQCLKSSDGSCKHCDMNFGGKCPIPIKECVASARSDLSYVIFKKLEKVGEPITVKGRTFQKLILDNYSCTNCVFNVQNKKCYKNSYIDGPCSDNGIWVEIKRTNEDMEENKLNLKPFDIQKAREGKPVCTRDGKKARIICFDYKGDANDYPILALISTSNLSGVPSEIIAKYTEDGRYAKYNSAENGVDLMMLPEKKEGWVNIYEDMRIYASKEEAKIGISPERKYITTTKIEWEE